MQFSLKFLLLVLTIASLFAMLIAWNLDDPRKLNAITIEKLTRSKTRDCSTISLPEMLSFLEREGFALKLEDVNVTEQRLTPHYSYDNLKEFVCWTLWQMNLSYRVEAGQIVIGVRRRSDHEYYWNELGCTFLWAPDSNYRFAGTAQPGEITE